MIQSRDGSPLAIAYAFFSTFQMIHGIVMPFIFQSICATHIMEAHFVFGLTKKQLTVPGCLGRGAPRAKTSWD